MVDKITQAMCGFRDGQNGTGNCLDFIVDKLTMARVDLMLDKMALAHVWISLWIKWHWQMYGFRGGQNGTGNCVDFMGIN